MLLDPSKWLASFMQLTPMAEDFKVFILILGLGYFAIARTGESYVFPLLSRFLNQLRRRISKTPKKRKEYRMIYERMR
jgi:cation-transporting ATPase 13A2